jgi:hypothetical protein
MLEVPNQECMYTTVAGRRDDDYTPHTKLQNHAMRRASC